MKGKNGDDYHRILATNDAEADDDDNHHNHHQAEVVDLEQQHHPQRVLTSPSSVSNSSEPKQQRQQRRRRRVKRRGSHASADSFHSAEYLTDDEEQLPLSRRNSGNGSGIGRSRMMEEQSPLQPGSGLDGSDRYPHSSSPNNNTESTPKSSVSNVGNNSNHRIFASAFEFSDDEDDDDELDIKRYNLDFSNTYGGDNDDRVVLTTSFDGSGNGSRSPRSSSNYSLSIPLVSLLPYLWFSFQSHRQRARQRRAQLLLQQDQSRRRVQQTVRLCWVTYCDATDVGIALLIVSLGIWLVVLSQTDDDLQSKIFWMGTILLGIRIGARPFWQYCSKRRRKLRLLLRQQRQRQVQSPSHPTMPNTDQVSSPPVTAYSDDLVLEESPPIVPPPIDPSSDLELHSIAGMEEEGSLSNASDPVVASL